jgi:hypothetical protein
LLFLLLSSLIIVSWHAGGVSPEAAAQEPNRCPPAPPPLSIQGRRWWPRKEASNLGPIWLRPKMESRILGRRPAPKSWRQSGRREGNAAANLAGDHTLIRRRRVEPGRWLLAMRLLRRKEYLRTTWLGRGESTTPELGPESLNASSS